MQSLIVKARENLVRRRAVLLERASRRNAEVNADERAGDLCDAAGVRTSEALSDRMGVLWRAELAEIDAALARIDEGTFGTCIACGEAIGRQRLLALPEARHCLGCRTRPERPL